MKILKFKLLHKVLSAKEAVYNVFFRALRRLSR